VSTCARCGVDIGENVGATCAESAANSEVEESETIACRDRELANLRSLLRSVTGKLEEAAEHLQEIDNPVCAIAARMLVDQVLEALS
jgi:hypothetical protein